jgi:hypothetical protein
MLQEPLVWLLANSHVYPPFGCFDMSVVYY